MKETSDKAKERAKADRREGINKFFIVLTMLLTAVYLVWRVVGTYPHNKGVVSWVFFVLLLCAEIFGLLEMAVHFFNMYDYENRSVKKPVLPEKKFPDVDIFVPTFNEPVEVLRKTLNGCLHMNYPEKSKVHIYLCDDGERTEMRELAQKLQINYLGRTSHEDAKAGNLNYALKHSSSDFVAVFDADMIPRSEFLMETIPYFEPNLNMMGTGSRKKGILKKEGRGLVGFVQTPQCFYEPDVFQYNLFYENRIPNEQDYFYRVVQMAKNKTNSVVFGGSNTVLARSALVHAGGFTSNSITEDFATGIEIEKMGYRCIAVNKVLANGMPAKDMKSLLTQRSRWAKGCIQAGKITKYLRSEQLSFYQKINYFTSISYWYGPIKRVMYLFAPILFALCNIVVVECTLPSVLMFWLPMYICTNICISRFSQKIRTNKWTNIYDMVLFPYLLGAVLKESFGRKQKEFKVTKKEAEQKRSSSFVYCLPYLFLIGVVVASMVSLILRSVQENTVSYLVIFFWLLINLYYLIMALFVAWGRKYTIESRLLAVNGELKLEGEENTYAVTAMGDHYLMAEGLASLGATENISAELCCGETTVALKLSGTKGLYEITEFASEEEEADYWTYLYDREMPLPSRLKKRGFYVDEIVGNLVKHIAG